MHTLLDARATVARHTPAAYAPRLQRVEILPFTVRVARTWDQLERVCELRATSYGHHIAQLGELLSRPDDQDFAPDTVVLIAEEKETGTVIGTARLQSNLHGPLALENSIELPEHLTAEYSAEITRLSVRPGYNDMNVRNALWKACHRYCLALQIQRVVITARRPLVRQYAYLGFKDLFDDHREVPCAHVGGLMHRVLLAEVQSAERTYFESHHPLYEFVFNTAHPDIEIFSGASSVWARPRMGDQAGVVRRTEAVQPAVTH